ncbi:ABC transporter ATP-binding protein/permease [Sandaracinobacter sp. RS1-74]|uniref:ABC transporter ATP-binding protein n=1 Tax=Sandaracinobacteroides sayramensis TaxID=2913411 RepID=UPI001EDABB67|nr:ABC transporter ATP-binding protein [Sandaracinobacteroides sayramensis]MCG2842436.1 ABC transporter ATP-binding protein/permease [Sandaracinobacteroides sayramensis]
MTAAGTGAATSTGAPAATSVSGALDELGIDRAIAPRTLRRVVSLAGPYRLRFTLAMAACLVAALANLALPLLLGHSVDQVSHIHPGDAFEPGPLLWTAGLLLLATATRGLFQMIAGYQAETVGQNIGRDLRLAYFEKLQRLEYSFHDRIHSGDLITRGMLDLEGVRGFLEVGVQRIVQLALLLGVGGWLMLRRDTVLALLILGSVPLIGLLAGRMGIRLRLAWTRLQQRMAVLTRVMEENLQGARLVRVFPARDQQMQLFDEAAEAAMGYANQRIEVRSLSMAQINGVYYAAMLLVLAVGASRVQSGQISVGNFAEFLAYMTILQVPVRQISMIMNAAARAVSSGARLFEILDREPSIHDTPGALPLPVGPVALQVEHVSFRYQGANYPVLRDIDFTVVPGRVLGIVGPAGAGKSSLAHLIARFYDVTSGAIRIGDVDIRDATLDSVRRQVAIVQQDVFLFDDSLAANIAYGEPLSPGERVRQSAAVAQLEPHVAALPLRYRTRVGERGSGLSGGQRQRVAVARALATDASVLILDDATSALDAATDHALRDALRRFTAARATIVISHRVASVAHADEILVLEQGAIVERGTHDELLALGGHYAGLHAMQTRREPDDSTPATSQELVP